MGIESNQTAIALWCGRYRFGIRLSIRIAWYIELWNTYVWCKEYVDVYLLVKPAADFLSRAS